MKIPRTQFACAPRGAAWVNDPWDAQGGFFADVVHLGDYPTHSTLLGPCGKPLEYEARQPIGFDLSPRKDVK